jgi:hypothetical protein
MICSGSTILSGIKISEILPNQIKIYKISFKCFLTEGDYFIHFALTEGRGLYRKDGIVKHDARRSVAIFKVLSTPHLEGICDLGMLLEEVI